MKRLIKYEIINVVGNIFAIIFGLIFPIMMTLIFYTVYKQEIPPSSLPQFATQLFVTNMLMIPLALIFIGFSALFSQEIEKGVTTRLTLFGISESKQMQAKMVAQAVTMCASLSLYCIILVPTLEIPMPSTTALLVLILTYSFFSILCFVIAYAISKLARRFSVTYGITMSIYFTIMVLSGMMGIQPANLPQIVRYASNLLPTTHMVETIPALWNSSTLNYAPLVQSFLFMGALAFILQAISSQKQKRILK